MSALLDADTTTVVIEGLDFEPKCGVTTCGAEATFHLLCNMCGGDAGLCCGQHALVAAHSTKPYTHRPCGEKAPLRLLVKVSPL